MNKLGNLGNKVKRNYVVHKAEMSLNFRVIAMYRSNYPFWQTCLYLTSTFSICVCRLFIYLRLRRPIWFCISIWNR